jgi:hypothetical protein
MSTVKKGILTISGEWWKHLRWKKRAFWKGERRAGKSDTETRSAESESVSFDSPPKPREA